MSSASGSRAVAARPRRVDPVAFLRALRDAGRDRWVLLGTLATALIVIGSLTPAYLPQNSPWWPPVRALHLDGYPGKIGGTVLVLAGLLLLTQAWLMMRSRVHRLRVNAVLCWWSLPLLLGPPVFSHDAYSYAAQGWLAHNGLNPYLVGPGALPGAFADQAPWVWRFTPTPYGPLSLVLQQGIVEATGLQPYASAVAMRVPALLGVALIALLLPRIATRMRLDPDLAAWLGVINPILITDFVGGAHNDALMTGLLVLGVWLAFRRRVLVGAAVIGVAAAIKQPALLGAFAIAFVGQRPPGRSVRDWLRAGSRAALTSVVAVAMFALVSLATGYGFGWLNAVNVPGSVITISPFTLLGQLVQLGLDAVGADPSGRTALTASRTLGMGVSLVIMAVLAVRVAPRRPMDFLACSYLAVALCGPALHGWYMMWGGVFLPLTRPSRRVERWAVLASVLLLSYAAINLSWRNGSTALGVAALAFGLWQTTHYHRNHHPEETA